MLNRRIGVLLGGLGLLMAACAPATPAAPTVEALPTAQEAELTPSVTVTDQDVSGGTVSVPVVVAAEPGWLVIHTTVSGAPGPVIGQAPVLMGANADIQVEIDLTRATDQLFAMLHVDAGVVGEYEFPGPDVPVTAGDQMVNVPFNATFEVTPFVTVSDQLVAEGTVTIDKVSAAEDGWIAIHTDASGSPGPVIGFAPVGVGNNLNVVVEIDEAQATPILYAMLHLDAGVIGEYNFPGDDGPVFDLGGYLVMSQFELATEEASSGPVMVLVIDVNFREKEVTVPVGTTITWKHEGNLPHTVTSDDGLFESGSLSNGESFSYTFDVPGTFAYFCRFHGGAGGSGMAGVIIVEEG